MDRPTSIDTERAMVRALSCAALAAAGALLLLSPGPAAASSACGELGMASEGEPTIVTVRASRMRCPAALGLIDRALRGSAPGGWECHSAGVEGTCSRNGATASYGGARNVRRCGSIGFDPNSDNVAGSISAKRTGCKTARRVARASRSSGPIDPASYGAAGFACRGAEQESALPSALYVCRRGRAIVVFSRT